MLNQLIDLSLRQRALVIALSVALLAFGVMVTPRLPLDVLPNVTKPTVTLLTEAPGLAPEETDTLVTMPLENALNGAPGLERLRSNSDVGLSLVFAEFGYGTDIYRARQLVQERLQTATGTLPRDIIPQMLPATSLLGEILLVGVRSRNFGQSNATVPMEIRTLADTTIQRRLLGVRGVANVLNMGGGVKQFLIQPDLAKLQAFGIRLEELQSAAANAVKNATGGYITGSKQELAIRAIGQTTSLDDIAGTLVKTVDNTAIRIRDVADVTTGVAAMRGDAAMNGTPGVILGIEKQPNANTLSVTRGVEQALTELRSSLPSDLELGVVFRQATFIERAVKNLVDAVRDGALMVVLVLVLFLLNIRTTVITLTAIPLSFALTALVFAWFDLSINSMTLGGLAVALGMVVDDAIVDVENVFRRLKENRLAAVPRPAIRVVADASKEVRQSIVYATLLVVLVFLPLFALDGVEGQLFAPVAVATIVSLLASFVVSLTVVPALCSLLLPNMKFHKETDGWCVRWLKRADEKLLLGPALRHPWATVAITIVLFAAAAGLWPLMGRQFLPAFNEGSFLVTMVAPPGTSLTRSQELGAIAEAELRQVADIAIFSRRTGRAEKAEHVMSVNVNEFDIELKPGTKDTEKVIAEVRERLGKIPGVFISPGQPIQHRIDHMLSGVQAQIALKIFGPDLATLRGEAEKLRALIASVPGLADVNVEQQALIPQLRIEPRRDTAEQFDSRVGGINERIGVLLGGETLGEVREGMVSRDLVLRLPESARQSPEAIAGMMIEDESGRPVELRDVAHVELASGPNVINRENAQRRIIISANSTRSDLVAVVDEIRRRIEDPQAGLPLPEGYYVTYDGQYRSQQEASRRMLWLAGLTFLLMTFLLHAHFKSAGLVAQVMLNIPLAFIGALFLTWIMVGTISIATLVGLITLAGIASRNTIMMISHYLHLLRHEGEQFDRKMILRGSLERLVPVTMTALTAALALVPLALSPNEPGKEILYPVAVAILGGLFSSTLLDCIVTPTVFFHFGRRSAERWLAQQMDEDSLPASVVPLKSTGSHVHELAAGQSIRQPGS